MNGKKAKELRHGNEASYLPYQNPQFHPFKDRAGTVTYRKALGGTPRRLDPECSRAKYQQAKKEYKD